MSGCLMVNEALPALTSRFLLLLEDNEDDLFMGIKPKQEEQVRRFGTPITNLLEESKEPDESPVVISPFSSRNNYLTDSPLWSSLPRFDSIPAHNDSFHCPSTPLSNTREGVNSFTSYSSNPMESPEASRMWQYIDKAKTYQPPQSPFSLRTTDAVWRSPEAPGHHRRSSSSSSKNIHKTATILNPIPMAPSLLLQKEITGSNRDHPVSLSQHGHGHNHDGPPSVIGYRTRSYSSDIFCGNSIGGSSSNSSLDYKDDDEVSLLADDPDDDDDGVLPHATYDVVVNILDEIDRDNGAGAPIQEEV